MLYSCPGEAFKGAGHELCDPHGSAQTPLRQGAAPGGLGQRVALAAGCYWEPRVTWSCRDRCFSQAMPSKPPATSETALSRRLTSLGPLQGQQRGSRYPSHPKLQKLSRTAQAMNTLTWSHHPALRSHPLQPHQVPTMDPSRVCNLWFDHPASQQEQFPSFERKN